MISTSLKKSGLIGPSVSITPLALSIDNSSVLQNFQNIYETYVDTLCSMSNTYILKEADNMILSIKPIEADNSISSFRNNDPR